MSKRDSMRIVYSMMPNMKHRMQIKEIGCIIFIPGINGPNFCLTIVLAHRNDFVGIED